MIFLNDRMMIWLFFLFFGHMIVFFEDFLAIDNEEHESATINWMKKAYHFKKEQLSLEINSLTIYFQIIYLNGWEGGFFKIHCI